MTDTQREMARHAYWLHFDGHKSACVMGVSKDDAMATGASITGKAVIKIASLPYPASPVLNSKPGDCPSFCYTPEQCVGNSCCRKSYACSE